MSLKGDCKKMINQLWDLGNLKERHVYTQWMVSHIGVPFKHAPYEALKTLHFILKYKLEHGRCPYHEVNRNKNRKKQEGSEYKVNRAKVIQLRGNTCENCGKPNLTGYDLTVDHIIPLFQGGSNGLSNLKILCQKCHNLKTKRNREPSKAWKQFVKNDLKQRIKNIKELVDVRRSSRTAQKQYGSSQTLPVQEG